MRWGRLLAVGLLVAFACAPPAGAEEKGEELEDVLRDYVREPPLRDHQLRDNLRRILALDMEEHWLWDVLRDVLQTNLRAMARYTTLRLFEHEIPSDLAYRDYPFIRAVEEAQKKRVFGPDEVEAYEIAKKAWAATLWHYRKLVDDPTYRLGDDTKGSVATHPRFRDYHFASAWEAPFLVCAMTGRRADPFFADPLEQRMYLRRVSNGERALMPRVRERVVQLRRLYEEFLLRYAKPLGLTSLTDEWGGRPDLPVGVRSFQDGVPLVTWVFPDRKSWRAYHRDRDEIPAGIKVGYFKPGKSGDGWIFFCDEAVESKAEATELFLKLGTYQIVHWFRRQQNRWQIPPASQDFFDAGFARWLASVTVDGKGEIQFQDTSTLQRAEIKKTLEHLVQQDQAYLFPLRELVRFSSYRAVQQWGAETWGFHPAVALSMFYHQSYAFIRFLNVHEGGRYKPAFLRFFRWYLQNETWEAAWDQLVQALNLPDDPKLESLERTFHAHIRDDLLK